MNRLVLLGVLVTVATTPVATADTTKKLERANYDFRIAKLDPKVIGTHARCDADLFEDAGQKASTTAREVTIHCANVKAHSSIVVALPPNVLIPVSKGDWHAYTQIEVEIDGESREADAHTKLVRIVGATEDERPSRCLCKADREPKTKPPEGFDFHTVKTVDELNKRWGKRELCVVSNVLRIGRSRGGDEAYRDEDAFDRERLPYYAEVYCSSKSGSMAVLVGASTTYQILALRQGMAVEIELGWVKRYAGKPTGRLAGIRYEPREH